MPVKNSVSKQETPAKKRRHTNKQISGSIAPPLSPAILLFTCRSLQMRVSSLSNESYAILMYRWKLARQQWCMHNVSCTNLWSKKEDKRCCWQCCASSSAWTCLFVVVAECFRKDWSVVARRLQPANATGVYHHCWDCHSCCSLPYFKIMPPLECTPSALRNVTKCVAKCNQVRWILWYQGTNKSLLSSTVVLLMTQ